MHAKYWTRNDWLYGDDHRHADVERADLHGGHELHSAVIQSARRCQTLHDAQALDASARLVAQAHQTGTTVANSSLLGARRFPLLVMPDQTAIHQARLALRVLFGELLRRLPDVALAGDIERLHSTFIGGVKHVPVRFTPAA